MSSPPYMPVFVADFIADTQHLTCEQGGAYWRILMHLWRHGGFMRNDVTEVAQVVGLSVERWLLIGAPVMCLLNCSQATITHRRLCDELDRAYGKSRQAREGGRRGGLAKARNLKDKSARLATVLLGVLASPLNLELEEERGGTGEVSDLSGKVSKSDISKFEFTDPSEFE